MIDSDSAERHIHQAVVALVGCRWLGLWRAITWHSPTQRSPASTWVSRYSRTASGASLRSMRAAPQPSFGVEFCLLASASIRSASMAILCLLTTPSSMQCVIVSSNRWHSNSLSRKRPWPQFPLWSGQRNQWSLTPRTQFKMSLSPTMTKGKGVRQTSTWCGTKADRSRPLSDLNATLADRVKIDRYLVSILSEWHLKSLPETRCL